MDEEDRFSASSGESDRDNEPEDALEDADDVNNENEAEEENNDEEEEEDGENEADGDYPASATQQAPPVKTSKSATPTSSSAPLRPTVRPEALTAKLYDIVPTMAAPQSTSINAMAITPDLRYWITGGSDGYIRKYDGPGTINGRLALTVAQRHPFVDSVHKAGILMSYWENEEPLAPNKVDQEPVLSPVYSLAVHSGALWLLSGLESGAINLQSVRHDEGKKIGCLQEHSNAVSVLTLAPDEKSVLSGGWDKKIFDWDLNTGQATRRFDGSGGQISSIELRPANGDPIPAGADAPLPSTTITTNNGAPALHGMTSHADDDLPKGSEGHRRASSAADGQDSPAHESLFGGSDAGSLFGDTAGEQPFGHDNDDGFGTGMEMMAGHESAMDHSADMAMADMETEKAPGGDVVAPPSSSHIQPGDESVGSGSGTDTLRHDDDKVDIVASAQSTDRSSTVKGIETEAEAQPWQSQPPLQDHDLKRSQSPIMVTSQAPPRANDPSQTSATTFLSSAMDGTIRLWDRRVSHPVARIGTRSGVPPWCMSACWSPDGNMIYAGRRNGTVEEYDVRHATRRWEPERTLKFPNGSGAVSAVKPMVNGRHLVCASHDIMRLYDLRDSRTTKHSSVPFLIIPGPPRAGVISCLYIDPTSRFMLSAAGTRGWDGTCTEALIGYEINVVKE